MTLEALAGASGCDVGRLAAVERGEQRMTSSDRVAFSEALQIPPGHLIRPPRRKD
jgi:transcriptional regulator with XRE-family HTH domain